MKWRNLVILGGLVAIVTFAIRRRRPPDGLEISVREPDNHHSATSQNRPADDLESIDGIGSAYASRLREAGVTNVADLVDVDSETLAEDAGIAEGRIRAWVDRANDRVHG